MKKLIDWHATEAIASELSDDSLDFARQDAYEAAQCWPDPDTDPDGNAGYYRLQESVYAREQACREGRVKWAEMFNGEDE